MEFTPEVHLRCPFICWPCKNHAPVLFLLEFLGMPLQQRKASQNVDTKLDANIFFFVLLVGVPPTWFIKAPVWQKSCWYICLIFCVWLSSSTLVCLQTLWIQIGMKDESPKISLQHSTDYNIKKNQWRLIGNVDNETRKCALYQKPQVGLILNMSLCKKYNFQNQGK